MGHSCWRAYGPGLKYPLELKITNIKFRSYSLVSLPSQTQAGEALSQADLAKIDEGAESFVGDDLRFGQKFTQMLGANSFRASAEAVFELADPEALRVRAPIRAGFLALCRRNAPPLSFHPSA